MPGLECGRARADHCAGVRGRSSRCFSVQPHARFTPQPAAAAAAATAAALSASEVPACGDTVVPGVTGAQQRFSGWCGVDNHRQHARFVILVAAVMGAACACVCVCACVGVFACGV